MIQIVRNLLSESLFNNLRRIARTQKTMRNSITSWSRDVIGVSAAIMVIDIEHGPLHDQIRHELSPHIGVSQNTGLWYITIHLGGRLSYIPWHDDEQYGISVSCYLNDNWSAEFAGHYLWQSPDGLRAVLPERNLAVIQTEPTPHSVALSNLNAPMRESLQVFVQT